MLFSVANGVSSSGPRLVLLHGFGADENDLIGLAPYLDPRFRIESVRAPLRSPMGGYAWFNIEFREEGLEVDPMEVRSNFDKYLIEFLEAKEEPVFLAGFSQGAMMALGVLLERPDLVRGVVAMSGRLLPIFEPTDGPKTPVLITHGTYDPVVPVEDGRSAATALTQTGLDVEYREYPMQHEINLECLRDIDAWLRQKSE